MRNLLCVVMDGVGVRDSSFGNAVALARTPSLEFLAAHGLYTTLKAHGKHVGLPGDTDIGNSEVGHNALGAGRIYSQGATLVQESFASRSIFQGQTWQKLLNNCRQQGCLHLIGLLSDGNVHSHESHLYEMLQEAYRSGIKKIRVHTLLDGRDVDPVSAEIYAGRLEKHLSGLRAAGCDALVASGGGRMTCTMDRYEADWSMVERGWKAHVLGEGRQFPDLAAAIRTFRENTTLTDQNFPEFVIARDGRPVGTIEDGDSVIFFNFRGDRAIEISRAFEDQEFSCFDRKRFPRTCYAGMMEYDGDAHIPRQFLVSPPAISETFSEHLVSQGIRQFACSETQKFGHVTYFWNGNRSGCFDEKLEEYLEIPSDLVPFNQRPWMKAREITDAVTERMRKGSFQFGRINFANGDMVGHTGDLDAAVLAVSTVDTMIGELIRACQATGTRLMVTADHGNCDEMFAGGSEAAFPEWLNPTGERPRAKTAHTLAQVPFYLYDPLGLPTDWSLKGRGQGTLAAIANTALELTGLKNRDIYEPSLIIRAGN